MSDKPAAPSRAELRESLQRFKKPAEKTLAPKVTIEVLPFWQIVVIGHIDFRQHTPVWYGQIGAIDEIEKKAASQSFTIDGPLPLTFEFDTGKFRVKCMQDRWEIFTGQQDQKSRIIEVADVVFKKLNEMHVTAFGMNTQQPIRTKHKDVAKRLADLVIGAGIGLPRFANEREANIALKNVTGDDSAVINVARSPAEATDLMVMYNREHRIVNVKGYFDLGDMIRERANDAWQEGEKAARNVLKSFDSLE